MADLLWQAKLQVQRLRWRFVLNNEHHITQDRRELIQKALSEWISLLGICRVFNGSPPWLFGFAESVWKAVLVNIGLDDWWLKKLRPKAP